MFDVGFSEMTIIAIVALIVFGPEELPRVARTAGHLLGRLRRYVADVKSDISREMELADLKRLQQEVEASARELEASVQAQVSSLREEFQQIAAPIVVEPQPVVTTAAVSAPETPSIEAVAFTPDNPSQTEAEPTPVVDENQLDLFGNPLPRQPAQKQGE